MIIHAILSLGFVGGVQADLEERIHEKFFNPEAATQTHAAIVLHRGDVLYEAYAEGFDEDSRHLAWSISKSVTSLLVGAAIKERHLKASTKVEKLLPEIEALAGTGLRVCDLLYWSSGIDWKESYEDDPLNSSVIPMLFGEGRSHMARYVAELGFRHKPDEKFYYSTGDSQLLMAALLGSGVGQEFPFTHLFDPLGIENVTWERDSHGDYVGGSSLFISARGLAKIGELVRNKGEYQGRRLLSKSWFKMLLAPSRAFARDPEYDPDLYPGGHWWLNRGFKKKGVGASWPHVPEDAFAALGHWGQSLIVVPSKELVVVRFANDRFEKFDKSGFVSWLITELEARS